MSAWEVVLGLKAALEGAGAECTADSASFRIQVPPTRRRKPNNGYRLSVIGYRLSVIGHRLSVIGIWLLGYGSVVTEEEVRDSPPPLLIQQGSYVSASGEGEGREAHSFRVEVRGTASQLPRASHRLGKQKKNGGCAGFPASSGIHIRFCHPSPPPPAPHRW